MSKIVKIVLFLLLALLSFTAFAYSAARLAFDFNLLKNSTAAITGQLAVADAIAPTTTATAKKADNTSYTFGMWVNTSSVSVTLACSDSGGSGCYRTYYCTGSATCTPTSVYSSAISFPSTSAADGVTYYLRYYSRDVDGNSEDVITKTILIDTVGPVMDYYKARYLSSWLTPSIPVYSDYTEDTWIESGYAPIYVTIGSLSSSSMKYVYYCMDNGTYTCVPNIREETEPLELQINSAGITYLRYYGEETSGSSSSVTVRKYMIDGDAPTLSYIAKTASGETYTPEEYTSTAVIVDLTCSDATSSCKKTYYCIADTETEITNCKQYDVTTGGWDLYGHSIYISSPGTAVIYAFSLDEAGNMSNKVKIATKVSTGATASLSYTNGYYDTASVPLSYSFGPDEGGEYGNFRIQRAKSLFWCGSTGYTPTCETLGSYSDLATLELSELYNASYTDTTVESGYCYQYRLVADTDSNDDGILDTTDQIIGSSSVAKIDAVAPSGGSISYINGSISGNSVIINYSTGIAGELPCFRYVKIKKAWANLEDDVCQTFSDFGFEASIGLVSENYSGTYTDIYTDSSMSTSKCYKYALEIINAVGGSTIYTSDSIVKVYASGSTEPVTPSTNPPTTTASASRPDGTVYTFGTCTGPLTVNLSCSGENKCASTYYCIDDSNTCTPTTTYTSSGVAISYTDPYKSLHDFGGTFGSYADGKYLYGSLTISSDGSTFYGMTRDGGKSSGGVLFSISLTGENYNILHHFQGGNSDGKYPYGSLYLYNSKLYGMTYGGGGTDGGLTFSIDTTGSNFLIKNFFTNPDTSYKGFHPYDSLTPYNTILYGMTFNGGKGHAGTIFSTNTSGAINVLHHFGRSGTTGDTALAGDGAHPYGSLVRYGTKLYGMTSAGGSSLVGAAFSLSNDGSLYRIIHNFTGETLTGTTDKDGKYPYGSLTLSSDATTLYGMTSSGGNYSDNGTIFSMTTSGASYKILHHFYGGTADGRTPYGTLTLYNGKLYGMTSKGGKNDSGVLFSMDTTGSNYKVLYHFTGGGFTPGYLGPGGAPYVTDSAIYGMLNSGKGSIFRLSTTGYIYIRYYSKDINNNIEVIKSSALKIDDSAPTTTVSAKKSSGGSYTFGSLSDEKVIVTMTCSDTSSGACAASCSKTYYCVDSDNTCTPDQEYASGGVTVSDGGTSYIRYYSVDTSGNMETVSSKTIKINNYAFLGAKLIKAKNYEGNYWCLPGGTSSAYPGAQMTILGGDDCDVADGGASDNGECKVIATIDGSGANNPPEIGTKRQICPQSTINLWSGLTNILPSTKYVLKITTNTYCPGIYSSFAGNKACWAITASDKSCSDVCGAYGLDAVTSGSTCYNNAFSDCSLIESLKGSSCNTCNKVASNGYNYYDSKGNCYYTYQAGWSNNCSALGYGLTRICSCESDNTSDNFYFSFTTPSSF